MIIPVLQAIDDKADNQPNGKSNNYLTGGNAQGNTEY